MSRAGKPTTRMTKREQSWLSFSEGSFPELGMLRITVSADAHYQIGPRVLKAATEQAALCGVNESVANFVARQFA